MVKVRERRAPWSFAEIWLLVAADAARIDLIGCDGSDEYSTEPAGAGPEPNASPVTNQPSKFGLSKRSNTIDSAACCESACTARFIFATSSWRSFEKTPESVTFFKAIHG